MLSRRISNLSLLFAAAVAACAFASAGCNGSDEVTGVGSGAGMASVDVTGTWNGTFQSGVAGCSSVPMRATLAQSGNKVTGSVATSTCGLTGGHFSGTITGTQLTGSVGMQGCTGGAVAGTVSADAKEIRFTMDDLKKPLVTGDQVVAPGGDVTLRK